MFHGCMAIWTLCNVVDFTQNTLQWRHNGRVGVSNQQPHDCLLNRLVKAQINENIKASRHWPLVRRIHRSPVNSPHGGPETWKMLPFDDVILSDDRFINHSPIGIPCIAVIYLVVGKERVFVDLEFNNQRMSTLNDCLILSYQTSETQWV